MALHGRRVSQRAAAPSVLVLASVAVAAACNMLTGAGELSPCEGPSCADPALTIDGATTIAEGADVAVDDPSQPRGDGAPGDATPNDSGTEGGSMCPVCDGGECCAPNMCVVATGICGSCSAANGPCQLETDCCAGLKCSTSGRCVSSCLALDEGCSLGSCCLGSKCSIIAAYKCTACGLAGTSCNGNSTCCSNKCVNDVCVGNVSSGAFPGP